MRSFFVVEFAPSFNYHLRLFDRTEPFTAQTFISEFPVKAFAFAVLPRLAGRAN